MKVIRRNGTRLVYEVQYLLNGYVSIFHNINFNEIEEFIVHSLKFCIKPKYYTDIMIMPDDSKLKEYELTKNKIVNKSMLIRLIRLFNEFNPMISIDKAMQGNVLARDLHYLSAARYLRSLDRMIKLKDIYKANRINILLSDLLEHAPITVEYDNVTLNYFSRLVKNKYLPDRSFYVKK